MSLADEIKKAAEKMKKAQAEEAIRTPKRRSTGSTKISSSGPGGTASRVVVWSQFDEVIALYLCLAGSSKFLKENYAKKRKMSLNAMQRKIEQFEEMKKAKGTPPIVDEQTKLLFDRFSKIAIEDLKKIVISILRGECQQLP